MLLELSAWSGRQSPCIQHQLHSSSNNITEQQVLLQAQQQLLTRRKARKAAVELMQRRTKHQGKAESSSSIDDSSFPTSYTSLGADWEVQTLRSCVMWAMVLLLVCLWGVSSHWGLAVPVVLVVVCLTADQMLLPSEAAVQRLASILDANGMAATLVSHPDLTNYPALINLMLELLRPHPALTERTGLCLNAHCASTPMAVRHARTAVLFSPGTAACLAWPTLSSSSPESPEPSSS